MAELVVRPLGDAFIQVGVFVALMLALFGLLQWRLGDRLTHFLAARWRSAPLVGALLGVTPGCGGAIIVMPLYLRGTVSFGTVVAALVATMGDASFVLIAADPQLALLVHGVLLAAGIISGYLTDALGIAPTSAQPLAVRSVGAAEALPPPIVGRGPTRVGALPGAFWALSAVGFLAAVPVTFGLTNPAALPGVVAGIDPVMALGTIGTLCAVALYATAGRAGAGAAPWTASGVLIHAARETSFVVTWVAAAYLATTLTLELGGIDLMAVAGLTGVLGVLAGAAIGLTPGCAPQILLTGLYVTGAVPLPTLMANAASQDGDALFPLLVMDRRAAMVGAAVSTVPGLVVGGIWLVFF